jgi:undecaprenyl-phosphate 4-deoxy-4-formamido-L-arabinose transferase
VLGGLQLLALGIMGEYIGRLHLNVNRKPQYAVRHVRRGKIVEENEEPQSRLSLAAAGKQQS